jgi:hypothetical protein
MSEALLLKPDRKFVEAIVASGGDGSGLSGVSETV